MIKPLFIMNNNKTSFKLEEKKKSINLFEQLCDPEKDELLLEVLVREANSREKENP